MELLKDAPEDMRVFVCVQNEGVFGFQEACEGETGEIEIGPPPEDLYNKETAQAERKSLKDETIVFAILPHGFGGDEENNHIPDFIHN